MAHDVIGRSGGVQYHVAHRVIFEVMLRGQRQPICVLAVETAELELCLTRLSCMLGWKGSELAILKVISCCEKLLRLSAPHFHPQVLLQRRFDQRMQLPRTLH